MSTLRQTGQLPRGRDLDALGLRPTYDKVYLGFVRDHKDVQHMGRLRVWIPELCTDNETSWIIVDHASPFAGATNVLNVNNNPESAQTSYGMSFIPPDINNQVLCMFINGDPNRGVWFACLFQVNRRSMVPSVPAGIPRDRRQRTEENIITGEEGLFVPGVTTAERGGTANLPVRDGGNVTRSAGNSYTSNGILTPRGHNLVMDDDPEDGFIRLKTRHGVQIILHDNADRIIINNAFSTGKVVIDHDGKIDVYGAGSISLNSLDNINISAKNDVNIESREGKINIRSANDIRAFAKNQFHIVAGSHIFQNSQQGEVHVHANSNLFLTADAKVQRIGQLGINDSVRQGSINISNEEGNVFIYTRDGQMNLRSSDTLFLQSVSGAANLKSATGVNIQSDDVVNIKSGGNMFLQSNGDLNLRSGGGVVRTGPRTTINDSAVPDASDADTALSAAVAIPAIAGLEPETRILQQPAPENLPAPGTRTQLVTTIASRLPSAEPDVARNTSGPGYSGTDTVERKDTPVESTFKTGQVMEGQTTPLVVNGRTEQNTELGKYEGTGWNGDTPTYGPKANVVEGFFRPASEYPSVSARGLNAIREHEGTGSGPPAIPGGVFENACKSGIKMIGHGHVLTAAELQSQTLTINGSIDTGGAPRVVNVTVNWTTTALTSDQMIVLLKQDLEPVYAKIKSSLGSARITQDQFDSLSDFIFNIGAEAFDRSGIPGMIASGKYDSVPTEMVKWILACGTEKSELRARRITNAFTFSGTVRAGTAGVYGGQETPDPAVTSERAAQAMAWFQSEAGGGYTRAQAAGIVGNLVQESALRPSALNPRENAQGIAQWTPVGGRQQMVAAFIGKPVLSSSFEEQLRAITWELSGPEQSAGRALRATSGVDDATIVVDRRYERSAGTEVNQRISNARALMNNSNIP
jgi:GH24 family phage-related lysozyme (muramidase)/uncharacterized protein (DUF2345 family)